MKNRLFGRTGHKSSLAIFGAVAFSRCDQQTADTVMEQVIAAGVNHIDVAPSYGLAEERLAPWMPRIRGDFFVGCKTMERSRIGAEAELASSLRKLRVDYFDLYQLHAVNAFDELDQATAPGGALEALVAARQAGLTRFLGITSHGIDTPSILIEALHRFDFDSVLFPLNFIQYRFPAYRQECQELIRLCRERNVGTMIIKSICKGPWGEREQIFNTWYEPFTEPEIIQQSVNFVLSQDITGLCTTGEPSLVPLVLDACENYSRLSVKAQEELVRSGEIYDPLF